MLLGRFLWRAMPVVVVALTAVCAVLLVGSARSAGAVGGLIAFVRGDGIYVMRADGSGVRRLRQLDPLSGANGLSWSPDGRRLAFATAGHGNRLWLLDADGSDLRGIVLRAGQAGSPAWSPDGRQIAFTGLRDRGQDIWLMNADGSNQRRLTITPRLWVDEVAWSPAGGRIAFIDNQDDLYLVNTDASHLHKLASGRWLNGLDWSPDGQRIAFTREPTPDHDPWLQRTREIYVINVGDRSAVRLTRNNVGEFTPAWSPRGDKIVFVRGGAIYVMNANGTGVTRLTHNRVGGWNPAWQRASASAVGGAGVAAATTRYQDPVDDVTIRGGLDLRSVAVSHTATMVTFRLTVANASPIGVNDGLGVLIDVPPAGPWPNPYNMNGVDYAVGVRGPARTNVAHLTGRFTHLKQGAWQEWPVPVIVRDRTVGFSLSRTRLGKPAWFNFVAVTSRWTQEPDGPGVTPGIDTAPPWDAAPSTTASAGSRGSATCLPSVRGSALLPGTHIRCGGSSTTTVASTSSFR